MKKEEKEKNIERRGGGKDNASLRPMEQSFRRVISPPVFRIHFLQEAYA
jgi:hypothetical protein